jgi:hypothetical protein
MKVIAKLMCYVQEFFYEEQGAQGVLNCPSCHWTPPSIGEYKINVVVH